MAGVIIRSHTSATKNAVKELQANVNGPANLLFMKLSRHTPDIMVVKTRTLPILSEVSIKAFL